MFYRSLSFISDIYINTNLICKLFKFNSRYLICVISFRLPLSLFVFRVFTYNSNYTFSFYYFAFVTHFLYWWSYFHFIPSFAMDKGHIFSLGISLWTRYVPYPCEKVIPFIPIYIYWVNWYLLFIYFALQVILPLVKSYGDNSTLTLSPGRIFI